MPLWDESNNSIWMLPDYMDGIEEAGALPLMLPFTEDEETLEQLTALCDGFLFTGGHDVSPALYGEEPHPALGAVSETRDFMESFLLKRAIELNIPSLGICRGIQLINAVLGGTLWQDLPAQHPSDIDHYPHAPHGVPVHEVRLLPDTPLSALTGAETLAVNSSHHQAVKELAPGLEAMAVSPDGLIEAFYLPGQRFLWAVQWHPERLYRTDLNNKKIFHAFYEAMINQKDHAGAAE